MVHAYKHFGKPVLDYGVFRHRVDIVPSSSCPGWSELVFAPPLPAYLPSGRFAPIAVDAALCGCERAQLDALMQRCGVRIVSSLAGLRWPVLTIDPSLNHPAAYRYWMRMHKKCAQVAA